MNKPKDNKPKDNKPKDNSQKGAKKDKSGWCHPVNNATVAVGTNGVLLQQFNGKITQFARFKKVTTIDYYSKANTITLKDQSGAVIMTVGGPHMTGIPNYDALYEEILLAQQTFWAA